MAKPQRGGEEAFGNDSFLDVVANIVGILIILVVVASMRIKNMPSLVSPEIQTHQNARDELEGAQHDLSEIQRELAEITRETEQVTMTAAGRHQERAVLATVLNARQRELEERRNALNGRSREDFDLQQALARSQARLAQFAKEKQELDNVKPVTIEIKTYPTPISQIVQGHEAHFQLKGGLISHVPIDELLEKFKRRMHDQIDRLREEPELRDTIGPLDGFRMRYIVERVDVAPSGGGGGGSYVQLRYFALVPITDEMGETLDDALTPQSQFHASLQGFDPYRTTVTLWAYDDSFADFRAVRKHLHELGFSVAGRPLNEGQPIAGSPHGSKSAAQ